METVHFLGRVVPPGFAISIGYDPKINWNEATLPFTPTFIVHVKDSAVDVECQMDQFKREYYLPLYIRAFDLARAAVDLTAFSTGFSVSTVFEYFVHPNGTREPLQHRNAALGTLCTRMLTTKATTKFTEL